MSMRPIDFQASLHQVGEVARGEQTRKKEAVARKDEIDRKVKAKIEQLPEVDRVDIGSDALEEVKPVLSGEGEPPKKKKTPFVETPGLEEDFKGKFLDIKD